MSEEVVVSEMNIYQRLHSIMSELERVHKTDGKNGLKYDFVSHDSVSSAVQPLFVKYRVFPASQFTTIKQDGNRTELEMYITFVNIDRPTESVRVDGFGYGIDTQDKGPGKAYSYAWKYAIMKALCMRTGDDPENDNVDHKPTNNGATGTKFISDKPSAPKSKWTQVDGCISEAQGRLIWAKMLNSKKVAKEELQTFLNEQGWKMINAIPKNCLEGVIKYVESGVAL